MDREPDRPELLALLGATLRMHLPEVDETRRDSLARELALELGTAGGHTIIQERSLPRRSNVAVRLHGVAREVPTGTTARQLLPDDVKGHLVVAALIDRRAMSLLTPLSSECEIAPLSTAHWEGQRIYRQSLALLLLEAALRFDPALELSTGPSIGFAQRIDVAHPERLDLPELAGRLEDQMNQLCGGGARLREEWWTADEAREHFERRGLSGSLRLLSTWRDPAVPLVSYGSFYALRMGPLLPDARMFEEFRVLADDDVLLLVYGEAAASRPVPSRQMSVAELSRARTVATRIAKERDRQFVASQARGASRYAAMMTEEQDRWLETLDCATVGDFNHACITGHVSQLIFVSEGFQEKRISRIADEIASRADSLRVVCVAGPSSSGKTTFIRRLKVQLQVDGIHPVELGLDDYFVDRDRTPRTRQGEPDFEALEALRLDTLQEHVSALLGGQRVVTPRYDFIAGTSTTGRALELSARDLLLVEGIHALNPALLSTIPDDRIFRIFICPLAQLPFDQLTRVHASDVRLIRRIVRDRHGRGLSAAENILRWPSVRHGERQHIFPFQHHADAVFDSSLIYELGVLRVFAERYLLEVPSDHAAYPTAFRLLKLLDRFVPLYPDQVPPTSILREFVGGSGFEY